MNLKKAFLALFLLMLFGVTLSEEAEGSQTNTSPPKQTDTGSEDPQSQKPEPEGPPCFQKALQAIGLEGVPNAIEQNIKMCPGVKLSCCKPSDQVLIYEHWIQEGGEKFIQNRFAFYEEVLF